MSVISLYTSSLLGISVACVYFYSYDLVLLGVIVGFPVGGSLTFSDPDGFPVALAVVIPVGSSVLSPVVWGGL